MDDRKIPETLEEAYRLRDLAYSEDERDFYQEYVYNLRRDEYRSRGIRTEISSRRREHQSAIEFSREMFFLEVAEIAARNIDEAPNRGEAVRQSQLQAKRYATRLDTHAFLKQLAAPHINAVTLYRRNFLELLRIGCSAEDAYYLARVIGLTDEQALRSAVGRIREQGYPGGRTAYFVEKTAIQIRDLPGGMILILLTFFVSLFAFVWAANEWGGRSAGEIVFITLGLIAAGALMLVSAIFIVTFIRSINK
ncbi:hypothetical protein [Rubrobacter indicoceani]|uniref:hypothetical protein n=1 Tax=Rubrobacter indicoceani TaxID=2051957 RepID=UPI000E5A981B|nr:hypothetical protein [Rubrobacter indicoceani]